MSLPELIEQFNVEQGEEPVRWAVHAGVDDYLALVASSAGARDLPVVASAADLGSGRSYGSYVSLGSAHNEVRGLQRLAMRAETSATAGGSLSDARLAAKALEPARHRLERVDAEQRTEASGASWDVSLAECRSMIAAVQPDVAAVVSRAATVEPVSVRCRTGEIEVSNRHLVLRVNEVTGHLLLVTTDGELVLSFPSGELCSYVDSGTPERFGHELRRGVFRCVDRVARRRTTTRLRSGPGWARVEIDGELDGRRVRRTLTMVGGLPSVSVRTEVAPVPQHTYALSLRLADEPLSLDLARPGGWLTQRGTCSPEGAAVWPLSSAAVIRRGDAPSLVVATDVPTALNIFGSHVEVVVGRNPGENRNLPTGSVTPSVVDVALGLVRGGDDLAAAEKLASEALRCAEDLLEAEGATGGGASSPAAEDLAAFVTDHPAVSVAGAHAMAGDDWFVIQLWSPEPPGTLVSVRAPGFAFAEARRCDLFGRPIEPLRVGCDGAAGVLVDRSTVALAVRPA